MRPHDLFTSVLISLHILDSNPPVIEYVQRRVISHACMLPRRQLDSEDQGPTQSRKVGTTQHRLCYFPDQDETTMRLVVTVNLHVYAVLCATLDPNTSFKVLTDASVGYTWQCSPKIYVIASLTVFQYAKTGSNCLSAPLKTSLIIMPPCAQYSPFRALRRRLLGRLLMNFKRKQVPLCLRS